MAEVEIRTNLPELKSHLDRIGKEFGRKVVRSATASVANLFKRYAIKFAPNRTGRLDKSIYAKRDKDSTSGREHYVVGARYKKFKRVNGRRAYKRVNANGKVEYFGAYYWRWVHEGHKYVPPGREISNIQSERYVFRTTKSGKRVRQRVRYSSEGLRNRRRTASIQVPGNPFFKHAYDAGKSEAIDRFFKQADKALAKISAERTRA